MATVAPEDAEKGTGAVGRDMGGRLYSCALPILPTGVLELYVSKAPLSDVRPGCVWRSCYRMLNRAAPERCYW